MTQPITANAPRTLRQAQGEREMGLHKGQPFTWPVRVYWEDTDAGGIVFYANYLKFMERARTEWLRSLGISQSVLREATDSVANGIAGGMFVVSDTQLYYKQPARLDDQLLVTAQIVEKSRITLTIAQEIRLLPNGIMHSQLSNIELSRLSTTELIKLPMVCTGQIRIAWIKLAMGADKLQPARIPQHVLEVLQ
jgi:acyl-CoA thioester hydrolase